MDFATGYPPLQDFLLRAGLRGRFYAPALSREDWACTTHSRRSTIRALRRRVQNDASTLQGLFEPYILGEFFLASVKSPGRGDVHLLLFNWVTSRHMLLRLQMAHRVMAALIPGHIVLSVAEPVAPVRQLLLLFPVEDLRDHWRPLLPAAKMPFAYDACVDVFDRIYIFGRYPRVQTFVDEKEGWPGRLWQFRVYEDPLRRGSHRILIYTSDCTVPFGYQKREVDLANVYSFKVTLDGSTAVDWKASPVVPAVPHVVKLSESLTYSGHCLALRDKAAYLMTLRLEEGETAAKAMVDVSLPRVSLALNGGVVTFEKPAQGHAQAAVSYYS
ncbi:hypothetical protein C8R47DRAFT_609556 [Mycena vitilis]|nr:hypothetical protein C8R47DRAFT_609556 [Mycena vitilis]